MSRPRAAVTTRGSARGRSPPPPRGPSPARRATAPPRSPPPPATPPPPRRSPARACSSRSPSRRAPRGGGTPRSDGGDDLRAAGGYDAGGQSAPYPSVGSVGSGRLYHYRGPAGSSQGSSGTNSAQETPRTVLIPHQHQYHPSQQPQGPAGYSGGYSTSYGGNNPGSVSPGAAMAVPGGIFVPHSPLMGRPISALALVRHPSFNSRQGRGIMFSMARKNPSLFSTSVG